MAGLAAALVLSGCGSGGGGDGGGGGGTGGGGGKKNGSSSGSSSGGSTDGSTDGSAGSGGSGSEGGSLEGSWIATSGGKPLVLAVTGKTVTLLGEDVLCNGTADGGAGSQTLTLKCPKGNGDRTAGRVESVNGKSMKVAWEGAGTDEFLKTEGGKLPEGLPTAGMP
ncbi:hypothetical protein [Streptomyces sp. Je 1-369]|uniref:hypothetical protein n=1 Tax=Streptomyces sp. Je 1-369 TaxID=2966192 RepID=UPI002285F7E1|nr:hypothetical protein [Streptomyces sp. Je 1-369]WAL96982.1 hypothetical protein NOO62_22295 [Streptomyces sp. Je 1-369]